MKTTVNVARLVENVGVSAYLGAATLVEDPELLVDAASILTIEARHQTIHNLLAGGTSIPYAFDVALSPQQVLAIAGPFISGCDLGVPCACPSRLMMHQCRPNIGILSQPPSYGDQRGRCYNWHST